MIIETLPGQVVIKGNMGSRPEHKILDNLFALHSSLVERIPGYHPDAFLPYSFSLFAAAHLAGCISREAAYRLAGTRADFVREAEAKKQEDDRTAMGIVIGDKGFVATLAERFGLDWTNDNGFAHVLGGRIADLRRAAEAIGRNFRGFLTTEGIYHSEQREPERQRFAEVLEVEKIEDPKIDIVSVVRPLVLRTAKDVREELSGMMTRGISLEKVLGFLKDLRGESFELDLYVDVSPEGTMQNLLGRLNKKLKIISSQAGKDELLKLFSQQYSSQPFSAQT